jgi:hypothetical protein
MIDPELKGYLDRIERELTLARASTTAWGSLWRGCIYGAGYIIGALLIIVIIGWILNTVGVIPTLSHEVDGFRIALENISGTVK